MTDAKAQQHELLIYFRHIVVNAQFTSGQFLLHFCGFLMWQDVIVWTKVACVWLKVKGTWGYQS